MRASPQGGDFHSCSCMNPPCPVSKVCGAFSNGVLPSSHQRKLMATAVQQQLVLSGKSILFPDQQLKEKFLIPVTGTGAFVKLSVVPGEGTQFQSNYMGMCAHNNICFLSNQKIICFLWLFHTFLMLFTLPSTSHYALPSFPLPS